MNIIDHADGLHALAAIERTLREVFPVVEVWAEPMQAGADERLVFIVLAGQTPPPASDLTGPAPDFNRAGRLSVSAVDTLVARLDPPCADRRSCADRPPHGALRLIAGILCRHATGMRAAGSRAIAFRDRQEQDPSVT